MVDSAADVFLFPRRIVETYIFLTVISFFVRSTSFLVKLHTQQVVVKNNAVFFSCIMLVGGLSQLERSSCALAQPAQSDARDERPDDPEWLTVDNADEDQMTVDGEWEASDSLQGHFGTDYLQDANDDESVRSITFTPILSAKGPYNVFMWWPADDDLAETIPVDIRHRGGTTTVYVNQQRHGDSWYLLGRFEFSAGSSGSVVIRSKGIKRTVVADAVQFRRATTSQAILASLIAASGPSQAITPPVPEPSTSMLLGLGLLTYAVGWRRLRRRRPRT